MWAMVSKLVTQQLLATSAEMLGNLAHGAYHKAQTQIIAHVYNLHVGVVL